MRRAGPALLPCLLALAACGREQAAHDPARAARDVAKVKAAQRMIPPAQPLSPQPVDFADLDAPGVGVFIPSAIGKPRPGDGCGFVAATATERRPVFVAVSAFGLMKRDGRLLTFAADSGSAERARGLHAKYSAGAYALELSEGEALDDGRGWRAALTVRDGYARIVYFAAGEITCAGKVARS